MRHMPENKTKGEQPSRTTGKKYTKWVQIIPVKNKVAATIEKEFHKKIISKWGTPRILFTDNGKEFVNRIMVKLTQNFEIRHSKTPRYHPQSNPTERCNR